MTLQPGLRLDRYTLLSLLGKGGQAEIWRVSDPLAPQARHVIKIVHLAGIAPSNAERVRSEARTLARLNHPSLVNCHALFEDLRENILGLVLDEVHGKSLAQCIGDNRLSFAHREVILRSLFDVLGYVHQAGVVHRDIKPENILISDSFFACPTLPQSLKLVDFGIAVVSGNPQPLTRFGCAVGTLQFMAPEQLDPAFWSASPSMPTIDIWAFGVIGWLLLAGCHPSSMPDSATIEELAIRYRLAAKSSVPWPFGHVSGPWEPLLTKCLSLDAAYRCASAPLPAASLQDFHSTIETQQHLAPSLPTASAPHAVVDLSAPPNPVVTPWHGQKNRLTRSRIAVLLAVLGLGLFAPLVLYVWHRLALRSTLESATIPDPSWYSPTQAAQGCSPCCGGSKCIAVGRKGNSLPSFCSKSGSPCNRCPSRFVECVPYSCDQDLPPDSRWLFRLSWLSDQAGNPLSRSSNGSVCINLQGASPSCMPISRLNARGSSCLFRVPVTADDILSGRLGFSIEIDGLSVIPWTAIRQSSLGPAGLCSGWLNHINSPRLRDLAWFLDPISDTNETCLAQENSRGSR